MTTSSRAGLLGLVILTAACSTAGSERPAGFSPPQDDGQVPTVAITDTRVDDAVPAPPLTGLTLDAALVMAQDSHPRVAVARANLEAAIVRADGSGRWPNPDGVLRMETAPVDEGSTSGDAEYVLGISQALPLGDRLERSKNLATSERVHAEHTLDALLLDIDREVRGAFGTALYAEQVAELSRELAETSARERDLVAARVALGDAVPTDLTTLELTASSDAFEQRRAELLSDQARLALASALGTGAAVETLEGELAVTFDLPSLADLLHRLDTDPTLMAAQADRDVARARVELAEEERVPDLRLDLFYRRLEETDTNAFDVGVALPMRWFDDGTVPVRAERARLAVAEARSQQARLARESAVRSAHLQATRALEHLTVFDGEILPRTERALDAETRRHAAGDTSLAELLAARRTAFEARLMRLAILHEVLLAWAELSSFLGNER